VQAAPWTVANPAAPAPQEDPGNLNCRGRVTVLSARRTDLETGASVFELRQNRALGHGRAAAAPSPIAGAGGLRFAVALAAQPPLARAGGG
jgi:hypothetical protein